MSTLPLSLFLLSPLYPSLLTYLLSPPRSPLNSNISTISLYNSSPYVKAIGNTPMTRLNSLSKAIHPGDTKGGIWMKREDLNPGGTGKDRVVKSIMMRRLKNSAFRVVGVVEGSSGSTGIAWANVCRDCNLKFKCVVPDDQSKSKIEKIESLGGDVVQVRTAGIQSEGHYVNVARGMGGRLRGWVFGDQFEDEGNYQAHYDTTGPEILTSMDSSVDLFVMSCGTGGMLSGAGNRILESGGRVVAADVEGSVVGSWVENGVAYCTQQKERGVRKHRYDTIAEGIGMDRVTSNLGKFDKASGRVGGVKVEEQDIVDMAWWVLRNEGIKIGSSTAVNLMGCVLEGREGERIVTIMCSKGEREERRLWNQEFVESRGLEWREDWGAEKWSEWIEGLKRRRKERCRE